MNKNTPRNIDQTKNCFFEAITSLIQKEGLKALGINAIAREAGRDKALVYKYFTDLDGLYREYITHQKFFPTLEEILDVHPIKIALLSRKKILIKLLSGFIRELKKRPLTIEILRWELVEQNAFTIALSEWRGDQTKQFLDYFGKSAKIDFGAIFSLIYGGTIYLLLKTKNENTFADLDLSEDESWVRIEKVIVQMVEDYIK